MSSETTILENLAVHRADRGGWQTRRDPLAPAAADDVTMRMLHATICGTDRQIIRGERNDRARILGHEGIAEVAAVGERVSGFALGERFVFNPVNPRDQDEILGHSTDGIFQRYVTMPQSEWTRRSLLVRVPANLPAEHCVLAEPLGTVVYTHEILGTVRVPQSILIFGAGPIGILHALYAHRVARTPRVQIVCNSERRAQWMLDRGILEETDILQPTDAFADRCGSEEFDAVILCTPARSAREVLRRGLSAVADQGCIGLIGGLDRPGIDELPGVDLADTRRRNVCGHGDGMLVVRTVAGKNVHLFGHRGTAPRHLVTAMHSVARHPELARVLTHRVPLSSLPDLFHRMHAGPSLAATECVKLLVDYAAEPQGGTKTIEAYRP